MELLQAGECFCTSTCLSLVHWQIWFLQRVSCSFWWGLRHQLSCRTTWPSARTWPNPYPTTSSSPPTTHTWQVPYTTHILAHKFSPQINIWGSFRGFFCLSPCSWSVLWRVLSGDVPSVSAVRLPLSGAGLLEGQTSRWRAHHYPRLHHDNRDPLQGGYT